jgi:hypothetical protein
VLGIKVEGVNAIRSKNSVKLPIVLSYKEVQDLLLVMSGVNGLIAKVLSGCKKSLKVA